RAAALLLRERPDRRVVRRRLLPAQGVDGGLRDPAPRPGGAARAPRPAQEGRLVRLARALHGPRPRRAARAVRGRLGRPGALSGSRHTAADAAPAPDPAAVPARRRRTAISASQAAASGTTESSNSASGEWLSGAFS